MSRVIALVEGQTEQDFVRDVLAPFLSLKGVFISARLVGKPGHKGGVGEYKRARSEMLLLFKQEPATVITTMFDFYGMPVSWPDRQRANATSYSQKAHIIESAIKDDIARALGKSFDERRFLPYIQLHEFEALLFSDPLVICSVLRSLESEPKVQAIRNSFATPEEINDHCSTAPSKRLKTLFADYQKRVHGLIAAKTIGIEKMRSECPHFAEWLAQMEKLGKKQVGKIDL